ncbi:unnamed protein product [Ixodes persulcatus]
MATLRRLERGLWCLRPATRGVPGASSRRTLSWSPRPRQMETTTAIYPHRRSQALPFDKTDMETAAVQDEALYKERTVTVRTCAELFPEWKRSRPGWKHVRADGVDVPLPYIHTGLDRGCAEGPTVLAVHGAPGTYREFDALTPVLDVHGGASVVVPTLPDLEFSMKTQSFWHSVEEKTDLLKKFLEAINVREIDMVIAHSSSMYPILWLALKEPDIRIKSAVFIAPPGCRRISQLSPFWMMKAFDEWFRVPGLQNLMCDMAVHIVRMLGKPNNNQIRGTILSMITIMHARYDQSEPLLRELQRRQVPMLMLYGEKDRLIDREVSAEMAAVLGVQPSQMQVYVGKDNAHARLENPGEPVGNNEVVCFREGTHFAFKKYPDIFNDAILKFWRKHVKASI